MRWVRGSSGAMTESEIDADLRRALSELVRPPSEYGLAGAELDA